MQDERLQRTISSALWSAYADALGFPTELASATTVERRIGSMSSNHLVDWKRMVGGRSGAIVSLPAGTYSDDTQLRLATSRAIRSDGFFDVESFSKVELPVWLCYALGAGRGSKKAAASLINKNIAWFSNFYPNYVDGGGNGAAMRIQPHVWAAPDPSKKEQFLPDVIRNAISTHGHLRGIVGAVIHALSLASIFTNKSIPNMEFWGDSSKEIIDIKSIIEGDYELSTFWLPTWETKSNTTLTQALEKIKEEWLDVVYSANKVISSNQNSGSDLYKEIVTECGGLNEYERGSGLKCAFFSNVAAFLYQKDEPKKVIQDVVNFLGSDTDTIGTMVGALLGALHHEKLPSESIQDAYYISCEAKRLFNISQGLNADTHHYPDLLYWQPAKVIVDTVSKKGNRLVLDGVSNVKKIINIFHAKQKGISWVWAELEIGQHVLCKIRTSLTSDFFHDERIGFSEGERNNNVNLIGDTISFDFFRESQPEGNIVSTKKNILGNESKPLVSSAVGDDYLDKITDEVIKSGFDKDILASRLLETAEMTNGIELSIGFVSIIVKARRARLKKKIK
ncbi:ADP-ribosylglycohydrolase family protein [Pantoea agglomerans]|uniref:ADP-ribosylglycohydrolase family protein n=1 Tax=Enterobacter agglomerans TaxID=549 RepID=UPI002B1D09C0|nr:ADP-ribosylglycohydrolase family protein [Pantoea agglomerans]